MAMTCRELVELVTAHLEGALDAETEARVVRHLGACPGCERYVEQFRWTIRALGALPAEAVTREAEATLRATFRELRPPGR